MSRRMVAISADNQFVKAIDQAVLRARRADPEGYISRSGFIKSAIRRAMVDLDVQEPMTRSRQHAINDA